MKLEKKSKKGKKSKGKPKPMMEHSDEEYGKMAKDKGKKGCK